MLQLALIFGSLVVSFHMLVLIDHLVFGISWTNAAPRDLIATLLGHWLAWLWLYRLSRGKS